MKRDLELLRSLLVEVNNMRKSLSGEALSKLVGADVRTTHYHLELLAEDRFIEAERHYSSRTFDPVPDAVLVTSLTPDGQAFLEAVGEPAKWNIFLTKVGGELVDVGLRELLRRAVEFLSKV